MSDTAIAAGARHLYESNCHDAQLTWDQLRPDLQKLWIKAARNLWIVMVKSLSTEQCATALTAAAEKVVGVADKPDEMDIVFDVPSFRSALQKIATDD